jgi:hypothetical protein
MLKSSFQNQMVLKSGVVKVYYFASFRRVIFVDCGRVFRL